MSHDAKHYDVYDLTESQWQHSKFSSRPFDIIVEGADTQQVINTAGVIKKHLLSCNVKLKGPIDDTSKYKQRFTIKSRDIQQEDRVFDNVIVHRRVLKVRVSNYQSIDSCIEVIVSRNVNIFIEVS